MKLLSPGTDSQSNIATWLIFITSMLTVMSNKAVANTTVLVAEREEIKAPKFLDDMTWVGIPIFVAGIIAKGEKHAFRQNYDNPHANTRLVTSFKTEIDNYLQYFGPAMTIGLKIGGVEGRSDWPRMLASAGMGYAAMALMVNGLKYTTKEMRPDGSTANSWPSGHTATAFVGATMLHKEYGLTRSPWYSVAGYGMATATGVMRVLNNRHWVSDVLSGAGIGILCGELGYALSDLIFKSRGLLRSNLVFDPSKESHPSFFSISMGAGLGNNDLDFGAGGIAGDDLNLKFGVSTAVAAEGAYFFNKYIGLGGRLSVKSSPIKGWNSTYNSVKNNTEAYSNIVDEINDHFFPTTLPNGTMNPDGGLLRKSLTNTTLSIVSDHMTEFIGSVGFYVNVPLTTRLSIGTKALLGRSFMQDLEISASSSGQKLNMDYSMFYDSDNANTLDFYVDGREVDVVTGKLVPGSIKTPSTSTANYVNVKSVENTGETYEREWDYLTIKGSRSTSYGTGLSLSYRYKESYSLKVFCDVDFTKKTYTLNYTPYEHVKDAIPTMIDLYALMGEPTEAHVKTYKNMASWVIGGSFAVSF